MASLDQHCKWDNREEIIDIWMDSLDDTVPEWFNNVQARAIFLSQEYFSYKGVQSSKLGEKLFGEERFDEAVDAYRESLDYFEMAERFDVCHMSASSINYNIGVVNRMLGSAIYKNNFGNRLVSEYECLPEPVLNDVKQVKECFEQALKRLNPNNEHEKEFIRLRDNIEGCTHILAMFNASE